MADAFRGLTIRLGADARPLNQAINSVTKSAGQAQQQMNRLNKALKFNPANTQALGKMVDLAGDKAAHSARQVQLLKTALSQAAAESKELLRGSKFEGQDITKLASNTREAYAETQKLRSEYNHVNAELQHIYDAAKRVFGKKNKINWNDSSEEVNKLRKQFTNLWSNLDKGGKAGEKARKTIYDLVRLAGAGASNVGKLFGLDKSEASGEKLLEIFKQLRAQSSAVGKNLEGMRKIEGFRAIQNQLVAARAELRQDAYEAARLKSELYALGGSAKLGKLVSDARQFDNALEKSVRAAEEMKAATKMLPTNVEAARVKMHAMADAEDTIKQKLKAVEQVIKEIENTPGFDRVRAKTKNAWVEVETAKNKYASLDMELRELRGDMDVLASKAKELKNNKPDGWESSLKEIGNQMRQLYGRIRDLKAGMGAVEGEMKGANLAKSLAEARVEATKLKAKLAEIDFQKSIMSKLGGIGQKFRQFGYGMYASFTPAVMMAGRYAIQAADEIDSSFRNMAKTVNGSDDELNALRSDAIDFSRTHITSASQMLEIEAIGGQLGVQVENLRDFAHTVSNLDIATNMEAEEIATDLGKMATVMGLSVDQYDNFGDSLVRLGNNMPAMESDIMTITSRFMGMGKVVGMSADQMLAWATAATAAGQKPYAAGSSMQRFINQVNTAVAENGDELKLWAKVAGTSADEFAAAFENDASQALYSVIEGLGNMQKKGENIGPVLGELGIGTVQYRQLLLGLAQQMANATDESNILRDSLMLANDAYEGRDTLYHGRWEAAGDAMREAEKKSEGFSGTLGKLQNNAKALAQTAAEGLVPDMNMLKDLFEDLTGQVEKLDPGTKQMIARIGAITAIAGPATVGLGTIISSVGSISGVLAGGAGKMTEWSAKLVGMGKAGGVAGKGLEGLGKGLGFISTGKGMASILALVTYISWVTSEISKAVEFGDKFRNATDGLSEAMWKTNHALSEGHGSLQKTGEYAEGATVDYEALVRAQSDMVDAINQRNDAAGSEIGMLEEARRAIDEYAGRTDLTAEQQGELRAAIDIVNDALGSQYQVVGEANKIYDGQKDAILENVAALDELIAKRQEDARKAALTENYKDAYARDIENARGLAAAQSEYDKWYKKTQENRFDLEASQKLGQAEEHLREMKELSNESGQAVSFYSKMLGDAEKATNSANGSIGQYASSLTGLNTAFEGYFGQDASAQMDQFCNALNYTGTITSDFANLSAEDFAKMAAAWQSSNGDINAALASVGISARTAAEAFSAEMGKTKQGGDIFAQMCDSLNVKQDEFAQKLQQTGISAQMLSSVGSQAFQNLYNTSGQNLDLVKQKLDALDQAGIEPKNLHVTDDGSLASEKGNVIDFDNFQIGDKVYKITAQGKEEVQQEAQEVKASVDEVGETDATTQFSEEGAEDVEQAAQNIAQAAAEAGNSEVNVTFNTNADEAIGKIQEVDGQKIKPKKVSISADSSSAVSAIDKVRGALKNVKDKSVNVRANVYGKSDVDSLVTSISNLKDKSITITTYKKEVKQAQGGVNMAQLYAMPAFATGGAINGIVRRAMVTSQGLIGEAGTEAVLNMGRSAAVVPLSNRRYVRPFAKAVASEMGVVHTQPSQTTVMNVYLDGKFVAGGVSESTTLGELASGLRRKARA